MQHLASLLLVGAMGVAAHPSGHAHGHGRFHNRAIGDTITAVIDGVEQSWIQTEDYGAVAASTPTPAAMIKSDSPVVAAAAKVAAVESSTTSYSAAAAATSASASTSDSGSGVTDFISFTEHCASESKKNKRATLAQIAYTGNVGTYYGCNILPVASEEVAAQYDNTIKFYGATEDSYCLVWNKIGSDGGINGFFGADATTFSLAAGATQYVAIDANSQGGAACFGGSTLDVVTKTLFGEIAGTWLEFDIENSSNNGYSGADASCIVAQANGLSVPGLEVCSTDGTQCSSITADAAVVDNAYTQALVDADGIGIIVSGPLNINVNVGY